MHYLKCNKCGHLNELKSEYQTFCSNCDKKLVNNYSDWRKRNQDKNYDDFKKLVCLSEFDIQNMADENKPKPRKLKYWISFAVAFAVFYAIGQFGGEAIVKFFKTEKTSSAVLEKDWLKETYGSFGLKLETPSKMQKSEIPIPDEAMQFIEKMDSYEYTNNRGFKVMANSIKYKAVVGQANLYGAAKGSIDEMKVQKGVTDLKYSEESILRSEITGILQKGTYKQDGIGVEFLNAIFSYGLNLWQVSTVHQIEDENGRKAAARVVESIEIDI